MGGGSGEDEAALPRQLLFLGHCSVLHTGSHCGQQVGFLRCFCVVVACIHIIASAHIAACSVRARIAHVVVIPGHTYLLFLLLVCDGPIVERKLSLSPFSFY